MPTYNLREYSDIHLKASGSFWQCCKDGTVVNTDNDNIF